MLCEWDDGKFENEYLKKLERNWEKWKEKDKIIQREEASFSRSINFERGVISEL